MVGAVPRKPSKEMPPNGENFDEEMRITYDCVQNLRQLLAFFYLYCAAMRSYQQNLPWLELEIRTQKSLRFSLKATFFFLKLFARATVELLRRIHPPLSVVPRDSYVVICAIFMAFTLQVDYFRSKSNTEAKRRQQDAD